MNEQQLRQSVADIITAWVGAKKGNAKHLEILAIYNTHKPLARGYAVKVNDAYCATTVSAAYIKAGIAAYTGTECGVEKYVNIAQKKGIWVENDAYRPMVGDACVYDWQDNGVGDNTGAGDHIGIVTRAGATTFVVTEGNMTGGKVGTRTMKVDGRYIRGFIAPNYAAIAKQLGGTAAQPGNSTGSTYTVKAGDTLSTIATRYGTTYQALAAYNGISNPNVISVGRVIKIPAAGTQAGQTATQRTYTVKSGDSLWAIAARELGNGQRYTEIKTLNAMTSNTIHQGQVLKLPQK